MNTQKKVARQPAVLPSTLFTGDNLPILRGMEDASVDLIYLDPPFNSNRNYAAPIGSKAAGAAFKDAWTFSDMDVESLGQIAEQNEGLADVIHSIGKVSGKGNKSYLVMMAVRIVEMHRILKDSGSIYLHCDPVMSHSLKLIMDGVFGGRQFRNEIVWCYAGGGIPRNDFPRKHDVILRYARGNDWKFNVERKPYKENTQQVGIHSTLSGGESIDLERGTPVSDWWTDLHTVTGWSTERTGYPTQKPLALLERIIKTSSNEGDIVLDPFCGCATTCVAAEGLSRKWIGIDLSERAIDLVKSRFSNELGLFRPNIIHRTDVPLPVPRTVTQSDKQILYGRQEGLCRGCRIYFNYRNMTVDHIVPKSKGGSDHLDNLQLLCNACNSLKGDRPHEYLIQKLIKDGTIEKYT